MIATESRLVALAMKCRIFPVALLLLSLLASAGAQAQARWRDLPPEDRRQMRQQMRDHWQQARELEREDGVRRWQEVPHEDRRRLREELREQRHFDGARQERGWRRHD